MLVWNPKIFLRDKRFPVQAGSRPCQWGPLGWHSPRECHQSPREQMAVPYLPAQGRASTACRIPHAIPVKKAQIRLCLTPIQPNRKPHFPVLLVSWNIIFHNKKITLFFLLLSRSSMAYQCCCCHPLTVCSNLASDYFNHQSLLSLLSYTWLKRLCFAASPLRW